MSYGKIISIFFAWNSGAPIHLPILPTPYATGGNSGAESVLQ